jgi:GNAT superfamily N-acetyltransferase
MIPTRPVQPAAAILDAIDANYRAAMRAFGLARHVEIRDDETLFWFITGIPDVAFNSIMYARLAPEQAPGAVRELHQLRQKHAVPVNWLIGPGSRPAHLAQLLQAEGLRHFIDLPLMLADLAALPPTPPLPADFTIEPVTTPAVWAEWIEAERGGFEVEASLVPGLTALREGMGVGHGYPIQHFLGRLGGQPVATASLVVSTEMAGVFDVSTLPSARGRGIASAMTRHALESARAAGQAWAFVQPSGMAYPIYERLGFRECGACSVYG